MKIHELAVLKLNKFCNDYTIKRQCIIAIVNGINNIAYERILHNK